MRMKYRGDNTMLTCFDVADYFLSLQSEETGDALSNLKLQKLVYYAQGFWLAIKGEPLFNEKIEAWMHGPVVPELYRHYKEYGSNAIPVPGNINFSKYSQEQIELFDEIYATYGQYSAWKLRDITHEEAPWVNNYATKSKTISNQDMIEYFSTQLKDN